MKSAIQFSILVFLCICLSSFTSEYKEAGKKKRVNKACREYTEMYSDKITGIQRVVAKEKIRVIDFEGKNAFDLVWFKNTEEFVLAIKAEKKLCFENDIAVNFHLLEGKVITCASSHISNCESLMTIYFSNEIEPDHKIKMLNASEVVGISFDNKKESYKLKLKQEQARMFLKTINCITDQELN